MFRAILFLLIIFSALLTTVTIEQCNNDVSSDCHVFPWRSWGRCTGACGHQKRTRRRVFCCNAKEPRNVENCLHYCNFPDTFETLQNQSCRFCENGGTVLSASSSCICSLRYKGDCCEGRNNSEEGLICLIVTYNL